MSEQADKTGIPMAMQWEIKRLKVLQKETITMTPNKTQDVKPGQTIIVDLPYNSKIDLSSFSWFTGPGAGREAGCCPCAAGQSN